MKGCAAYRALGAASQTDTPFSTLPELQLPALRDVERSPQFTRMKEGLVTTARSLAQRLRVSGDPLRAQP